MVADQLLIAGYAIFGPLMLLWPLAASLPVLIALASCVDGPALAAQFAVRQQVVPPSLYGQLFTTAAGLKVTGLGRRRPCCWPRAPSYWPSRSAWR